MVLLIARLRSSQSPLDVLTAGCSGHGLDRRIAAAGCRLAASGKRVENRYPFSSILIGFHGCIDNLPCL